MAFKNLESLLERWNSDPGFRAELRQDPAAAIARTGISLTEEERSALASVDWSLTDEQLAARASGLPI